MALKTMSSFDQQGQSMKQDKQKQLLPLALGAALSCGSTIALAQEHERWYLGASAGQSRIKFDGDIVPIATATSSNLIREEEGTGGKIYLGRRISPNFAVEAGWTSFGKFSATRTETAPGAGSLRADIKMAGLNVDLLGIAPIGSFSLFAKIGGMWTRTKTTYTTSGTVTLPAGADPNPKKSGLSTKWGLGMGYDLGRAFALRAEWEQVQKVGDPSTTRGDVGLLSLGLVVKF
jgi:OmpA-OmpF porin, OOP family